MSLNSLHRGSDVTDPHRQDPQDESACDTSSCGLAGTNNGILTTKSYSEAIAAKRPIVVCSKDGSISGMRSRLLTVTPLAPNTPISITAATLKGVGSPAVRPVTKESIDEFVESIL